MRAFMRKVREAEGILSLANIYHNSASKPPMNDWNSVQHQLHLARVASDMGGQRTSRLTAWANLQGKLSTEHCGGGKHDQPGAGGPLRPVEAFHPLCGLMYICMFLIFFYSF